MHRTSNQAQMRPASVLLRSLSVASALVALGISASQAAITVTVSAAPGEPAFRLSDSTTPLPDGMHYQLGTFASVPDAGDAQNNPAVLFSIWQEFTDGIDDTIVSIGEDGGLALGDLDGDDSFLGKVIYWWVFNTSDGLAPAADFSNVTEHALFTGTDGWTFQAISPVISTSENLTFFTGSLSGGNIDLAAVPEPASALLALSAVAPLLMRRRR